MLISTRSVWQQPRIIGALMMREMLTRYGREGLGFFWVVAEPLAFCLGVIMLWSLIKPSYEHGVRLGPFVMTGYMCLLLLRHLVNSSLNALQANVGLLYHRQVRPLHIFMARGLLEATGTTAAFVVVYMILFFAGQVGAPQNVLLIYAGWLSLAWLAMGMALIVSALSIRFEIVERLSQIFMYLLIPLSGAFYMVAYLPPAFQEAILYVPMPHTVEMVRAGVFGEFVATRYWAWYPLAWGCLFNAVGLLLMSAFRDHVDVE